MPLRRPLPGLLALLVAGILMGLALPVAPLHPLILMGLLIGAACVPKLRPYRLPLIWLAVMALGWTLVALQVRPPASRALHRLMQRPREFLTVRGQITDDPVLLDAGSREEHWRFAMRIQEVNRTGDFELATGQVDVQLRSSASAVPPRYGDLWELSGTIHHFPRETNWRWASLPPYRMQVFPGSARQMATGGGHGLRRISFHGRRIASERLGLGLDDYPEIAGIMRALLLGYRHELPAEHHQLFAWTGTLHIFAISGLHVGIWATLLFVLVRAGGVSKRYWMLWIAPLLIVYVIGTGLRPSAVRACIMTLTFTGAYLFNRRPDAASAWSLAALVILVLSPTQITAPGFIFSFVIVAGLIRLYPLFCGPARSWWAIDPYRGDAAARTRSLPHRALMALIGLGAASLAAWLSSAPLTAYYFGLVTPIGLIGNMLVIPAAFVVVLGGILSLIAGAVVDIGAEVFNHANRVILTGLIQFIDALSAVPGGYRFVRPPPVHVILIAYGFIFGGAILRGHQKRILYGGLTLALLIVGVSAWRDPSSRIDVLPVGDGHAVLIASGRDTILYDAGPAYRSGALIRSLRQHGVNAIDILILSHASANHAGGAVEVMDAFPVSELWYSAFPSRSPAYNAALAKAQESGITQRILAAGDVGEWDDGLAWEVLHPSDATAWGRAADASIVLRVSRGTVATVLTGGGGAAVERAILQDRRDPTSTIWIMGSGGPEGAASQEWLDAMSPTAVIVDVSPFNRHGLPSREVVERVAARSGVQLLRTDQDGEISVRLDSRIHRARQVDRWEMIPSRTE